jgi:hypothetical protein
MQKIISKLWMGTFAERAFVRFFLSFAVCFRLHQTNRSLPFPFSLWDKQMQVAVLCKFRFPFEDVEMETWNLNVEVFYLFIYINKFICEYI